MANRDIAKLEAEFPEMSQSVIADVFKTYGKDTKKATEALRAIENQTSLEKDKKIRELSELFPTVPKNDIESILDSCNGDVDAAVVPLFNKAEEIRNETTRKEQQESKKRRDQEAKLKKEEEIKKKTAHLMGIFENIPRERVQQILDENEGDIEETTNQLLEIVAEQELAEQQRRRAQDEEKRLAEEQERRLQDLKMQALREKFDNLTEAEVIHSLSTNGWDIKKALVDVLKVSNDKKVADLKNLFPTLPVADLEAALQANDYNVVKAVEVLSVQKKQEDSPTTAIKVTVKKVEQDLLARSVMLGQQIEEQVKASHLVLNKQEKEAEKKAITQQFRDDLENIIATQARHGGSPGLAPPPLPKQIDAMLGKQKPIEDSPVQSIQQTMAPPVVPENENMKNSAVKWNITVAASPSFPDVGNPITVQWEINADQVSTGYDWIGIFPVDQPNKQYLTYQWVGKDKKKGTLFFNAPNHYGEYEFRYFANSSYAHSSISNRVKVGPQVQLTATLKPELKKIVVNINRISGNDQSRAWVGLFDKNQTDNKQYVTYEYAKSDEILFDAPIKPSLYEIRFFTNSYVDVARSNPVSIEGKDNVTATWENGLVTVHLNLVTVDPAVDNVWVGLYFTTETNNKQWRRYKYVAQRASIIQFKSPKTAGSYEARVFACNKYDAPIIKSNIFKIGSLL